MFRATPTGDVRAVRPSGVGSGEGTRNQRPRNWEVSSSTALLEGRGALGKSTGDSACPQLPLPPISHVGSHFWELPVPGEGDLRSPRRQASGAGTPTCGDERQLHPWLRVSEGTNAALVLRRKHHAREARGQGANETSRGLRACCPCWSCLGFA